MNRYIQLFATVILVQIAITSTANNCLLPRLLQVNKEWLKHNDVVDELKAEILTGNESHTDLIGIHLRIVESSLRKNSPKYLTIEQSSNRAYLLDKLHQYWQQSNFPINNYLPFTNPVFIDSYGTHCAVGYLMQQSGYEDLALAINDNERFAFIKEIKTKGVTEWANKNGLTIDELAWIQPGYPPTTRFEELGSGTNGPVNKLQVDDVRELLYISGRYDTLDNLPCINIGYYQNNHFNCLGNGIEGTINDYLIYPYSKRVIAAGSFPYNGSTYPLAIYDELTNSWSYHNISDIEGAIATSLYGEMWGSDKLEVAISNPYTGAGEIWYLSGDSIWTKRATIKGTILSINVNYYGKIYTGSFDSATLYFQEASTRTLETNNILLCRNFYDTLWADIGSTLSDTIYKATYIGQSVYGMGSGGSAILWRKTPQELQTLVVTSSNFVSIKDMIYDGTDLLLVGDFGISAANGHYGNNIGYYKALTGGIDLKGNFNATINTVAKYKGQIYVGGEFTNNGPMRPMKYIARIKETNTAINEPNNTIDFKVYPNPSSDYINLELPNINIDKVELLDMSGRILLEQTSTPTTIAIDKLSQGIYFVRVHSNEGIGTTKFIKN